LNDEYDFSTGQHGAVGPHTGAITLLLDDVVIDWFRATAEATGGGDYQLLIDEALREHIQQAGEPLEAMLRRVIREELHAAAWTIEAQRRYVELRSGEVEGVPAEEVLARIRSRLSGPETCLPANDGEHGTRE
jgi:hypothetical protein